MDRGADDYRSAHAPRPFQRPGYGRRFELDTPDALHHRRTLDASKRAAADANRAQSPGENGKTFATDRWGCGCFSKTSDLVRGQTYKAICRTPRKDILSKNCVSSVLICGKKTVMNSPIKIAVTG